MLNGLRSATAQLYEGALLAAAPVLDFHKPSVPDIQPEGELSGG
jgi:hypothetical protein